jgi:hypothetical protein
LCTTRPVLQPPSIHMIVLFTLVSHLYHRTNTH